MEFAAFGGKEVWMCLPEKCLNMSRLETDRWFNCESFLVWKLLLLLLLIAFI